MRDKAKGGINWMQLDTEGNLVAKLGLTHEGDWMIIPEPDYPLVILVETGIVQLWDRKNHKPIEFAKDSGGEDVGKTKVDIV